MPYNTHLLLRCAPHGSLDYSSFTLGHLNISGWTVNNNNLRNAIILHEPCDIFSVVETHLSDNQEFRPNVEGYIFEGFNRSFTHINAPGTWGE